MISVGSQWENEKIWGNGCCGNEIETEGKSVSPHPSHYILLPKPCSCPLVHLSLFLFLFCHTSAGLHALCVSASCSSHTQNPSCALTTPIHNPQTTWAHTNWLFPLPRSFLFDPDSLLMNATLCKQLLTRKCPYAFPLYMRDSAALQPSLILNFLIFNPIYRIFILYYSTS